jgi:hypothetical protein
MAEISTFALMQSQRTFDPGGRVGRHERRFLDYVIDGEPLYERMRLNYDLISPLWFDLEVDLYPELTRAVELLIGEVTSGVRAQRTPIYVCSLCGDLSCGAITAKIERTGEIVTWNEWGYQNDFESVPSSLQGIQLPELSFELSEYEQVFRRGLEQLIDHCN